MAGFQMIRDDHSRFSSARQRIAVAARRALRCLISVLAMAVGGEAYAGGVNYTWNGSGGTGVWSTAANWVSEATGAAAVPTNDGNPNLLFAGTVALSSTNTTSGTYALRSIAFLAGAGAFTLSGNSVSIANAGAGIENFSSNVQTISLASIDLPSNSTDFAATSGDLVVNSALTGVGGIDVFGTGTTRVILSASNSYANASTVTSGVLRITNSFALGGTANGLTVATGAALELANNISVGAEALTLTGSGISATGALRNVSGTNTYGGAITFNAAATIAADANSLLNLSNTLGGNVLKTFGGAGNITATNIISGNAGMEMAGSGTLTLSANNSVTSAFTVSSGVVRATTSTGALGAGTLTLGGGNLELANDTGLAFNRNTTLTASGTIFSERLAAGAGVTHTLGTLGISGQTLTLATDASVTSGTAGLTFGTVTLSVDGATFISSATNTLLTLGAIGGNTFDFTVGGAGNTNITGIISVTTGGVTKTGAGTLTLSAVNTYTGTTTITGGTLTVGVASALGTGPVALNGGVLNMGTFGDSVGTVTLTSGRIIGSGTLTSSANFATTSGTIAAPLGGTGFGIAQGSGTTVVTSSNAFTGNSSVASGGVLNLRNAGALGTSGTATVSGGGAIELQGSGTIARVLSLSGSGVSAGGALRNISGTNGISGGITLGAASLITSDADLLTLSGTIVGTNQNLTFGGAGTITASNTISLGTGSLTKVGAGTLTLSGSNVYTGTTSVSAGTLSVSSTSNLGTATSAIVLGDAVNQGTLSYTGTSVNYTRGFTVSAGGGRLDVTQSGSTFTVATGSIGGTGAFTVGGAGSATVSSTISGVSSLTMAGLGTLTLSASNSFAGTTAIQSGTISVGTVVAGAVNQPLGTGARLDLGAAGASSGRLLYTGGSGTLSKNVFALGNGTDTIQNAGTGLLTLSGTLTKNGTILRLQGGTSGILVTGTIVGSLANSDLAVQNGLTTLSATNTYDGPTFVNSSGTLALGVSNAIPSNSAVTLGGSGSGGNGGPGVLAMGSFTNQIGSLAFSGSGGTIRMVPTASATSTVVLSATGGVVLNGAPSTLDLTGFTPSQSIGLYKLVAGTTLTSTFATVTGLTDPNFVLRYGSVTPGAVDLQRKANQNTTFTMTTANSRALVNTTVAVSGTVANSSPVNATGLALGLASTGLTGSAFTTGSVAGGSSLAVSGSLATGAVAGTQNWSITNTDANSITTTSTATGSLTVVNDRTYSPSAIAFGRFLNTTSPLTGTATISSTGQSGTTASGTIGLFASNNGLTLTLAGGTNGFNGSVLTQSGTYTTSGSFTGLLGAVSGSFAATATNEFGGASTVNVAYTGTSVAQRVFTVTTSTVALGRYLKTNAVPTGTTGVTSTGSNAVTANASLGSFSSDNGYSLQLTSGSANFAGAAASQTAGYTLSGSATLAGLLSGSFTSTVAAEFGSISPVVVNYTANPVDQRTFTTSTSTLNLGFVHQGGSFSSPTLTVTSTGLNATTESGTLGTFTGGASGFNLNPTSGSTSFLGASGTQSTVYTLSGSTGLLGAISGTYSSTVTREFSAPTSLTVAVTGQVYSGQSTWATDGGGNWGTFAGTGTNAFGLNWGTNQGSPGLDPAFANVDTATFGPALTSGSAAINTNGANISLAALNFNSAAGSYAIYQTGGSGPMTLLAAGTNAAGITVTAGTHSIHSDLVLGSDTVVNVASGAAFTFHNNVSGSAAFDLTKTGLGTLFFNGNSNYAGNTDITAGTVSLLSGVTPLGTGTVTVRSGATLDFNFRPISNVLEVLSGGILVNTGSGQVSNVSSFVIFSGTTNGTVNVLTGGTASFQSTNVGALVTVNNGGVADFTSASAGTPSVNVLGGGLLTVAGTAAGSYQVAGTGTFTGTLTGGLDVASGGVVAFNGSNTPGSTFNVDAGGLATVGPGATIGGQLHVSGSAVIAGSVTTNADVLVEAGGTVGLIDGASFVQTSLSNAGSLVVDGSSALTLPTAISGTGSLQKLGSGALTLTGTSTFTGPTALDGGSLLVDGSLASSVSASAGTTLGGTGSIGGTLSGAGLVSPGDTGVGILTAGVFEPTGGLGAAFEFTSFAPNYAQSGTGALNDVLRLTGATPFDGATLTSSNVIDIYLNRATVNYQDVFEGGFYAEQLTPGQLLAAVENATFTGWVRTDGPGTRTFGGVNYDPIFLTDGLTKVKVSTKAGPGNVGAVTQFMAVPEPSSLVLAGLGLLAVLGHSRLRRIRRTNHRS